MAALELQNIINVPANQRHTSTVIFVHGLGQTNDSWKTMVLEALAPKLPHVGWILPQAPNRSVSVCQGLLRPSWFDMATLPPGDEYDEQAIAESITLIKDLILSQIQSGIDPRRIVLVGFSQGAALSLMVSLTALHELGGVVSLSGWIPPHAKDMMRNVPNMPILWLHGAADEEIPLRYAQEAISFLRSSLLVPDEKLQFNVYSGLKHATNEEEINDLGFWLQKTLV